MDPVKSKNLKNSADSPEENRTSNGMDDDVAIRVENLGKTFKLPHDKYSSVKSLFVNFYNRKRTYELQHALQDVSFEVKKGEFFGIVGRNGSGKSTLLKLMAGIYSPTEGNVIVNGKLVPFIELGVGFNPELTGRENVYLNGALLGISRKEMHAMYKDIVEFAELEKFMDQKLKNYSSGMQVRLAFSIAIRAQGDILLLDEVLAVGDTAFQKKCMNTFEAYKSQGKTVVLVTHNMKVVEEYCNKAVLLHDGKIVDSGDPRKIAGEYEMENKERYEGYRQKSERDHFTDIEAIERRLGIKYMIADDNGNECHEFNFGDTANIIISWKSNKVKHLGAALVKNTGEYMFGSNTVAAGVKVKGMRMTYKLKLTVTEGEYKFVVGFFGKNDKDKLYFGENNLYLTVSGEDKGWRGLAKLDFKWQQ